jgi:hypothetical protein
MLDTAQVVLVYFVWFVAAYTFAYILIKKNSKKS